MNRSEINFRSFFKVFFAVLGFSFLFAFDVSAATLSISPSAGTFNLGDTVNVVVNVDTQGVNINALEAVLSYPQTLLTGSSISTASSFVTIWAVAPMFNTSQGRIAFAGGISSPGINGTREIFRASFTVTQAGVGALSISNALVLANDGSGTNVFSSAQGATYTGSVTQPPVVEPIMEEPLVVQPPVEDIIPDQPMEEDTTSDEPSVFERLFGTDSGDMEDTGSDTQQETTGSTQASLFERIFGTGDSEQVSSDASGGAVKAPLKPVNLSDINVNFDKGAFFNIMSVIPKGGKIPLLPVTIKVNGSFSKEDFDRIEFFEVVIQSDPIVKRFPANSRKWSKTINVALASGRHAASAFAIGRDGERSIASNVVGFNVSLPACSDGIDNDDDGLVDYPDDPGCTHYVDSSEIDTLSKILAPIVSENIAKQVASAVIAVQKTEVYQTIDKQVINNPVVEEVTEKVASPVIIVAAAANASVAINFASLFALLQGFFTQPLLLLTRRKRREWGQVYSSLTKLPVDLAFVRLFDAKTGKLVRTRVTDKEGRYLFLADSGIYKIEATKAGFAFPSTLMVGKIDDSDYTDLYHGDQIETTGGRTTIVRSIPIDPEDKSETPKQVIWKQRKKKVQKTVAWSGPIFAITAVAINPTMFTVGLLGVQFVLFGLFRRLAQGKKPRSWGIVTDRRDGKPLGQAVARIFDSQFNKLLETQITDNRGRYAFLVGKGSFYITVQRQGYRMYKSSLMDLTKTKDQEIIKRSVALDPLGPGEKTEVIGASIPIYPTTTSPPLGAIGVPTVRETTRADIEGEEENEIQEAPEPRAPIATSPPSGAIGVPTVRETTRADMPDDQPTDEDSEKEEDKTVNE